MKKTFISLLALSALTIAGVSMAEEIDRSLDADRDARIAISNLSGEVVVRGWDENRVHVTGELGADVEELVFERDGRDVTIKVKIPDRKWGRKRVTSDLDIRVPRESSLDISTVSADIDVDGVRGVQRLQSVSGDVSAEAFRSEINAEAVSGDVSVVGRDASGAWRFTTVSGDIRVRDLSGDIDVRVVSGDIELGGGSFERVTLETVNGDIAYRSGLADAGRMDIESVNGSVDINFTGDVSAQFEIETFNGGIRNCFGPKAERTSRHTPGLGLDFTEGTGEGRVTIETLNGRVTLCKG